VLLRIERHDLTRPEPGTVPSEMQLLEVVSPRTNGGGYTPTEHLFAALVRENGVSLEIAADRTSRRFYARTAGTRALGAFQAQLSAAYPQARLRPAETDPVLRLTNEQVATRNLGLREPEYLPLRILRDQELTSEHAPQADPLPGVLAALGGVPPSWLAVAPAALLLGLFLVLPAVLGFGSTFTDYGPAGGAWQAVGLANYRAVLADADLRVAFGNVCLLTAVAVPVEIGLGLGLAAALRRPFRGRRLVRVLLLLPWLVSPIAAGVMWHFLYNSQVGLIAWIACLSPWYAFTSLAIPGVPWLLEYPPR